MANPFSTDSMAAGYANSRPAVHPVVIERAYRHVARKEPFQRALDVGCGSGVSTKALRGFANRSLGLEPAESMLKWASAIMPSASFFVGNAEAIPLRDGSVDLISAAGSLNYTNLDLFFPEAMRVLTPSGMLLIYDFSAGRSFRDSARLDEWFSSFRDRYPSPPNEAQNLNPDILAARSPGFRVLGQERFEIGLTLTPAFYVDYMMTETNVAAAIRAGVPYSEIKGWCEETLAPVWKEEEREVLFRGYFICMTPE